MYTPPRREARHENAGQPPDDARDHGLGVARAPPRRGSGRAKAPGEGVGAVAAGERALRARDSVDRPARWGRPLARHSGGRVVGPARVRGALPRLRGARRVGGPPRHPRLPLPAVPGRPPAGRRGGFLTVPVVALPAVAVVVASVVGVAPRRGLLVPAVVSVAPRRRGRSRWTWRPRTRSTT